MTDSAILRFNRDLLFKLETDGTPEGSIVTAPFSGTIPGGGPILSFDSSVETLIPLIVDINPVQEGSGDPSPSNVRPISGWDSVNVYVSPTTLAEDGTTTTINLSQTVYGGVLDVVSGELTVDRASITLNGTESGWDAYSSGDRLTFLKTISGKMAGRDSSLCDKYKNLGNGDAYGSAGQGLYLVYSDHATLPRVYFRPPDSTISTLEAFKNWLTSNPLTLVYELATPTKIQLTPTEVKTLIGHNNIWSNSGDVYTAISTEKVTYKITGGAEDVQRFNKIWESLLLYQDGGRSNEYRNLSGTGDEIISHGPAVLKEE